MAHRDIIVIGASAGGIDVIQTILASLPWDFQASLFIVLHTSEDSPGVLPEILNRSSKLPVIYGFHNAEILPGRIYLAPGGAYHLMVERGKLRLWPGPRENRHRPAIDPLFRSAAIAYGSRVVGVILTGNLDDGSAGLAFIKERGGTAIVQDPNDAVASSMPESAIASTDIDFVLPASEIGPKLVSVASEHAERGPELLNHSRSVKPTGQTYSCPQCNGVLEEVEEGDLVRFRCRVGHIYSPESLHADQNLAVEKALWAAIRALEEHAEFSNRLASRSMMNKRPRLANRFKEKSEASREDAMVLRELLEKSAEPVIEMPKELDSPDERTGTD
jgi:two-component system, chemotaxis family, protein-glutamate methylesterase/glutaminase